MRLLSLLILLLSSICDSDKKDLLPDKVKDSKAKFSAKLDEWAALLEASDTFPIEPFPEDWWLHLEAGMMNLEEVFVEHDKATNARLRDNVKRTLQRRDLISELKSFPASSLPRRSEIPAASGFSPEEKKAAFVEALSAQRRLIQYGVNLRRGRVVTSEHVSEAMRLANNYFKANKKKRLVSPLSDARREMIEVLRQAASVPDQQK